jgi:hypothetical protein
MLVANELKVNNCGGMHTALCKRDTLRGAPEDRQLKLPMQDYRYCSSHFLYFDHPMIWSRSGIGIIG